MLSSSESPVRLPRKKFISPPCSLRKSSISLEDALVTLVTRHQRTSSFEQCAHAIQVDANNSKGKTIHTKKTTHSHSIIISTESKKKGKRRPERQISEMLLMFEAFFFGMTLIIATRLSTTTHMLDIPWNIEEPQLFPSRQWSRRFYFIALFTCFSDFNPAYAQYEFVRIQFIRSYDI